MNHSYPRKFVFAGNWAYSNLGCEAIVRGTTRLLREAAGECQFISHYFVEEKCTDEQKETDPSIIHRPFPFLKRNSMPWIQSQIERRLLHRPVSARVMDVMRPSLKEAEAVLMLGGDTFSPDYGNSDVYFALSSLVVENKVPVTLWGASIGPFSNDPDYEQLVFDKLRRVPLLCARETETFAYLTSHGLKENVILTADPSFYLQPSACELPEEIEVALRTGCIGLNLSPILYRYLPIVNSSWSLEKKLSRWKQVAAEVIRCIRHRFSGPILLIPHVFSESGWLARDDYLFLREVTRQIQGPEGVLVLEPGLNAAQTKWVISRLHVFAGARTHSTLAAISSGIPTICIGYSMKAKGIARDVYGHQDWLISGSDLVNDPSSLCDRLVSLYEQGAAVRLQIEQTIPLFQMRAREAATRLLEIIG